MDNTRIKRLSDSELEHARDLWAATYMSAWIHLMTRRLGINDVKHQGEINAMAISMVEPLNLATEATWCSINHDREGADNAMERLREYLAHLGKE